jgi:HPr kinase/phosphorylase
MSDGGEDHTRSVSVREFSNARELGLELEILNAGATDNEIASHRIQKLGLALSGYTSYIHANRIQILGGSEINYLAALDPDARKAAVSGLRNCSICCMLVTRGLDVPPELLKLVAEQNIPLYRSAALSSVVIARIGNYLERRLAPRRTVHGVLVDIFGLGILILGPSGIGKSECGLELVLKGHRIVADDYVEIIRQGTDRLIGMGGPILKHHMELRGLGVINIKELFGVSAIGLAQTLDMVVRLERWNLDAEYDRLGLDQSTIDFLGVSVPLVEMPVAPGRNIATLIEVAARVQLLKLRGYRPSSELDEEHFLGKDQAGHYSEEPSH